MFVYHFRRNFTEYRLEFDSLSEALDKAYDDILNSPSFPQHIVDTDTNKIIKTAIDISNLYREKFQKRTYKAENKFKSKIQVTYTLTFTKTLYTNDMKKTLEQLSKMEDCESVQPVKGSFKLIESQELFNLF